MITEERRLTFSRQAVQEALSHFVEAARVPVPPGHITGVRIGPDGTSTLMIERLGGRSHADVPFPPPQMMAVLLVYARECGIPVPKRARKRLKGSANEVVLVIELETPVRRKANARQLKLTGR